MIIGDSDAADRLEGVDVGKNSSDRMAILHNHITGDVDRHVLLHAVLAEPGKHGRVVRSVPLLSVPTLAKRNGFRLDLWNARSFDPCIFYFWADRIV